MLTSPAVGDRVRIPARPDPRGTTYPVIRVYRKYQTDFVDVAVPNSCYSSRYPVSMLEPIEGAG